MVVPRCFIQAPSGHHPTVMELFSSNGGKLFFRMILPLSFFPSFFLSILFLSNSWNHDMALAERVAGLQRLNTNKIQYCTCMQYIWFMPIGRIHKINILRQSLGKNQILPCLNPVWKEMNFKYFRTLLNKLLQNAWKSYVLSYGPAIPIIAVEGLWDFPLTSYSQYFIPLL